MGIISQPFKYAVVIFLMVIMLGLALIVAPISVNTGWRICRSWNIVALRVFGVEVESQFDGDPEQLDSGGVMVGLTQQSLLDPTAGYAAWDQRVMSML